MSWNGSGTFNRLYNWVTDKTNGIKITASRMDGEFNNFKSGLELCLTRDGQSSPTNNLPMGGFRHTGVSDATASNQYATKGQLDAAGALSLALGAEGQATFSVGGGVLILQWGQLTLDSPSGSSAYGNRTLATPFPNGVYSSVATILAPAAAVDVIPCVKIASTTTLQIWGAPGPSGAPPLNAVCSYILIGH